MYRRLEAETRVEEAGCAFATTTGEVVEFEAKLADGSGRIEADE